MSHIFVVDMARYLSSGQQIFSGFHGSALDVAQWTVELALAA